MSLCHSFLDDHEDASHVIAFCVHHFAVLYYAAQDLVWVLFRL